MLHSTIGPAIAEISCHLCAKQPEYPGTLLSVWLGERILVHLANTGRDKSSFMEFMERQLRLAANPHIGSGTVTWTAQTETHEEILQFNELCELYLPYTIRAGLQATKYYAAWGNSRAYQELKERHWPRFGILQNVLKQELPTLPHAMAIFDFCDDANEFEKVGESERFLHAFDALPLELFEGVSKTELRAILQEGLTLPRNASPKRVKVYIDLLIEACDPSITAQWVGVSLLRILLLTLVAKTSHAAACHIYSKVRHSPFWDVSTLVESLESMFKPLVWDGKSVGPRKNSEFLELARDSIAFGLEYDDVADLSKQEAASRARCFHGAYGLACVCAAEHFEGGAIKKSRDVLRIAESFFVDTNVQASSVAMNWLNCRISLKRIEV